MNFNFDKENRIQFIKKILLNENSKIFTFCNEKKFSLQFTFIFQNFAISKIFSYRFLKILFLNYIFLFCENYTLLNNKTDLYFELVK